MVLYTLWRVIEFYIFEFFNYIILHREIEKLKLSDMTCRQGIIEVAKM